MVQKDADSILVRPLIESDVGATAEVFYRSVREGAEASYDKAQREAWAPSVPDISSWRKRLDGQYVIVAEREGVAVGFMSLKPSGIIDLAFVLPNEMGRGTATLLYDALLAKAKSLGLEALQTEASLLALPFFKRQGWSVIREQDVGREGVKLRNYVMHLSISKP